MDFHSIILAATDAVQHTETQAESGGVLGTLGINWKIFLAQLINFGIVLFVFWKWVVKPLGATLTARQERIEKGLKNTENTEVEKKKFEEWKIAEMKKVRNEADNILRTTTDTANKIKQETIFEAQQSANKLIDQAKSNIESEKHQMLKEVKQEIATLVVTASEKILRHKLDAKKDHELISESLKGVK
ncbi:MAG: F0F1 ATP synthase subunit B [Candidatus Doudnabacteria bacterium]|nr:F0F1 ATP synthase subunit B [Candidatus Doudnabacteria bacterium]